MTPCIWLRTTHPCNPPNYGRWVNLLFFMMCIYKHCFPPMLLVLAVKCCTKMPCPLPHNHYCCLLSSPIMLALPAHLYMPHLFTHCLPTIICVMLMSIAFILCFLVCLYLRVKCMWSQMNVVSNYFPESMPWGAQLQSATSKLSNQRSCQVQYPALNANDQSFTQ